MRTIGVVTTARSDYSCYLPILRAIQADSELDGRIFASGMHLSPEFGLTIEAIQADGFPIHERVEMLVSSHTPEGISKSMGLGVIGFAQAFSRFRPDLLLALGDRFDMFAAVAAALPFAIPIAHIAGGESTEGAIDEAIRHSLTKMSHLHFVSNAVYCQRVIQMGEEPWRVTVTGNPSLDNLNTLNFLTQAELEERVGMSLAPRPLLVTYHPVTLEYAETGKHVCELLSALDELRLPVVFTYPNADTGSRVIIESIERFVSSHSNSKVVCNLGTRACFSLMKCASAMVGNSSSGILEAASFELPVVNLGIRQQGRIHGPNVIDADEDRVSILKAIRQVLTPSFRESLRGLKNPYGDGDGTTRIIKVLKTVRLDQNLLLKRFHSVM